MKRYALIVTILMSVCRYLSAQTNSDSVLTAYYPFKGNTYDESGNGNHGIVHGAALTTDRFGNINSAYSFDGYNDFIHVKDNETLKMTDGLTITAWINAKSLKASRIVNKWGGPGLNSYNIGADNGNQIWFELYTEDDRHGICVIHDVDGSYLNRWQFIVATYDGGFMKLYLNGDMMASQAFSGILNQKDISLMIGRGEGSVPFLYFDGSIDDIKIYNYALSKEEIDILYHEIVNAVFVKNEVYVVHEFELGQNTPNPFNISTNISYSIPKANFVTLKVYDILGRDIQTLVSEFQNADSHSIRFNADQLSSGYYIYKLKAGNDFVEMKKMVLIR